MRLLSCPEILAELRQNVDSLSATAVDLPLDAPAVNEPVPDEELAATEVLPG